MQPYNIFYNNHTGRVVFQNKKCDNSQNRHNSQNASPIRERSKSPVHQPYSINDFYKKIQDLNINRSQSPQKNDFYKKMQDLARPYTEQNPFEINNTRNMFSNQVKKGDSINTNNTTQIWNEFEQNKEVYDEKIINAEINKEIDKLNNNRIELNKGKNNMIAVMQK